MPCFSSSRGYDTLPKRTGIFVWNGRDFDFEEREYVVRTPPLLPSGGVVVCMSHSDYLGVERIVGYKPLVAVDPNTFNTLIRFRTWRDAVVFLMHSAAKWGTEDI